MTNFLDIFELELRKQAVTNSKAGLEVKPEGSGADLVSQMTSAIPFFQNADLLRQLADVVKRVSKDEQSRS